MRKAYLDGALFFSEIRIWVGEIVNGVDVLGQLHTLVASLLCVRCVRHVLGCGSHSTDSRCWNALRGVTTNVPTGERGVISTAESRAPQANSLLPRSANSTVLKHVTVGNGLGYHRPEPRPSVQPTRLSFYDADRNWLMWVIPQDRTHRQRLVTCRSRGDDGMARVGVQHPFWTIASPLGGPYPTCSTRFKWSMSPDSNFASQTENPRPRCFTTAVVPTRALIVPPCRVIRAVPTQMHLVSTVGHSFSASDADSRPAVQRAWKSRDALS